MGRLSAAGALVAAAALGAALVSGGSSADPRTPAALPGHPAPFLGTAVIAGADLAAAIDSYGNVVDLRVPGPAGQAQIANSAERQSAGTVSPGTGIVVRAGADTAPLPLWRAMHLEQSYLPRSNVLSTDATVAGTRVRILDAADAHGPSLARRIDVTPVGGGPARLSVAVNLDLGGTPEGDRVRLRQDGFTQASGNLRVHCVAEPRPDRVVVADSGDALTTLSWERSGPVSAELICAFGPRWHPAAATISTAARADRRWLRRARPLGSGAPGWANALYLRSLLALRALADRDTGATVAGLRDGWAYVWPRDAGTAAIALAAGGYRREAREVTRHLLGLDLDSAARFHGDGSPVRDGRFLQGDAAGWVRAAALASGISPPASLGDWEWRGRADYGERSEDRGDYLANAIAAGVPASEIREEFGGAEGLARRAGDPDSGAESAVAWAIRPFPRPALAAEVSRSLRPLTAAAGPYGIEPAEHWPGEGDPWSAPTAWVGWSLAALGERRRAIRLLSSLRRSATPAWMLPERADRESGVPRSTTPLSWSHAFAVLALQELWPRG